jgi:hypothetical protein
VSRRFESEIEDIVADAIRAADNSWFKEDYIAQAERVMRRLRAKGFQMVPRKLSDRAVEKAVETLPYGRLRPADYVRGVFKVLVKASQRY